MITIIFIYINTVLHRQKVFLFLPEKYSESGT